MRLLLQNKPPSRKRVAQPSLGGPQVREQTYPSMIKAQECVFFRCIQCEQNSLSLRFRHRNQHDFTHTWTQPYKRFQTTTDFIETRHLVYSDSNFNKACKPQYNP